MHRFTDHQSHGFCFPGPTCDARTKSAAFLAWFLENIVRLSEVDASDSICDGPSDSGKEARYSDHDNNNEFVFLQAKARQNDSVTLGDKRFFCFNRALSTHELVATAIAEPPASEHSKRRRKPARMAVIDVFRHKHLIQGDGRYPFS